MVGFIVAQHLESPRTTYQLSRPFTRIVMSDWWHYGGAHERLSLLGLLDTVKSNAGSING